MSEELTEEIAEQLRKEKEKNRRPDQLIEIRNTYEKNESSDESNLQAQLEAEKRKNENYSAIIEMEAQKQFESDRDKLLGRIPSGRREQISDFISDDPSKLEQIKASLLLQQDFDDEDDNEPAPTSPKGKAGLPDYMLPQNQGRQTGKVSYQNPTIQAYSDLYSIIRSPTSSAESKAEATQLLDDAFDQIGKGLRSRTKNNPYSLPSGVVSHCWKCGGIQEVDLGTGKPCKFCGYRWGIDKFPRSAKFHPR